MNLGSGKKNRANKGHNTSGTYKLWSARQERAAIEPNHGTYPCSSCILEQPLSQPNAKNPGKEPKKPVRDEGISHEKHSNTAFAATLNTYAGH